VRHHHERLDGSGYPARLAAEEIPLGARIIAVADTFDAITSGRSYCKAQPHKAALDIMRDEAGTQLDPDAVRAFRSAYFGRRWLWIPAAAMNGVPRLLAAAATRLADSAAITASTAALGAGAFVLPIVPAQPSSTGTTRLASITRRLSRPQDSQVGPRHSITASLNARALRAGTGSASESRRPKSKLTSKRGAPTVRKPGIGNPSPAVGTTTTEPISVAIPPGTAPSAIAKASLGANGSGVSASVSGPLSTSVSAATSPSASSLSASIPGATVVTAHPTQPLAAVNVRTPPGSILPSATASLP
jgi:hypothetical protein